MCLSKISRTFKYVFIAGNYMRHIARLCFFFPSFFQVHSVTLFRPLSKAECAAFEKHVFWPFIQADFRCDEKGFWLPFHMNETLVFLEQVLRFYDDKWPILVTPNKSLLAVTSAPASLPDETKIVFESDTSWKTQLKISPSWRKWYDTVLHRVIQAFCQYVTIIIHLLHACKLIHRNCFCCFLF